jgi:hypothetical protein
MAAAKVGGRRIGRVGENGGCLQHGGQRIVVCIETRRVVPGPVRLVGRLVNNKLRYSVVAVALDRQSRR